MNSSMYKEQWKDEVMDSLRNIRRAEPNPFLFTRIEAALRERINTVSAKQWRIAIAFTIILISINVWVLRSTGSETTGSGNLFNNHRYQIY